MYRSSPFLISNVYYDSCSVLQSVAVCCRVLQCGAVCCSVHVYVLMLSCLISNVSFLFCLWHKGMCVCACVRACVRVRVRMCMCLCACACACACTSACALTKVQVSFEYLNGRVCVFNMGMLYVSRISHVSCDSASCCATVYAMSHGTHEHVCVTCECSMYHKCVMSLVIELRAVPPSAQRWHM